MFFETKYGKINALIRIYSSLLRMFFETKYGKILAFSRSAW